MLCEKCVKEDVCTHPKPTGDTDICSKFISIHEEKCLGCERNTHPICSFCSPINNYALYGEK